MAHRPYIVHVYCEILYIAFTFTLGLGDCVSTCCGVCEKCSLLLLFFVFGILAVLIALGVHPNLEGVKIFIHLFYVFENIDVS